MAESRPPVADVSEAGTLLDPYLKGRRGAQLRSQLITLHPDASPTEIDEAIQIACDRFLTKADGITEHGQVYAWLRITDDGALYPGSDAERIARAFHADAEIIDG